MPDAAGPQRHDTPGREVGVGRVVERELSGSQLLQQIAPRDDRLVLETTAEVGTPPDAATEGRVELTAVEGPFHEYRRVVEWERLPDGRYRVRQRASFRPAMSVFGPLYIPLIRRALRTPPRQGWHPWWTMPDRLDARQSTVVAVMCLFHVVGGMLYGFLTNVLTFASADLGDGSAGEQSLVFVVTRFGAVLTLVVMASADRIGRRRVAVWSAAAAGVITVLSALSPTLWVLAGLQTLSRNLAITAMLAADTVSVEEIPAGSRAAAQGLGALSYGLGAGTVVVCLPLADVGPAGWRLVFAVGLLTLPLIALAARSLPESRRFEAAEAGRTDPAATRHRVRMQRLLVVGALFFLVNAFVAPSSQLQNDYLRAERGFDGARITLFIVLTGVPGAVGILLGGRWADRRGRRGVIVAGMVSLAVFTTGFFLFEGVAMWVSATLGAVLATLSVPAMGALAPELFPTARRGAARGTLSTVATTGSVVGLLAAGALVDHLGYGTAFSWLALAPLAAAALATAIPETAGRELEELNEGRDTRASDAGTTRSPRPGP
jgi:MFS family permease